MSGWTRPSSHSPPRVWRRLPGFIIQDLPPEREEQALEHIVKFFLRDEPMCKALDLANDRQSLNEYVSAARDCLPFQVSLVCIDESTNKFAAVNTIRVVTAKDYYEKIQKLEHKFKGEKMSLLVQFIKLMNQKVDPYKHFGVDIMLDSLALSVDPSYRKHGLGKEMVWACIELAKQLGIPATKGVFTSYYSQRIATDVGMETLIEVHYDEFLNPDGSRVFDNTSPHTSAKMMVGLIPKSIPPPEK